MLKHHFPLLSHHHKIQTNQAKWSTRRTRKIVIEKPCFPITTPIVSLRFCAHFIPSPTPSFATLICYSLINAFPFPVLLPHSLLTKIFIFSAKFSPLFSRYFNWYFQMSSVWISNISAIISRCLHHRIPTSSLWISRRLHFRFLKDNSLCPPLLFRKKRPRINRAE